VTVPAPSLEVLVTPHELPDRDLSGHLVIVIDVLRACTTIACALDAGATGIVPAESVEEATRLAAALGRKTTRLGGERGSRRIEGFDLGNSPEEYVPASVGGATVVLTTTNGARALAATRTAQVCLAAAPVTCGAAARRAVASDRVLVVCAGQDGRFSAEDFLAAGMLVSAVEALRPGRYRLDDGARAARASASASPSLLAALRAADHGRELIALGFENDLKIAAQVDRFPFVPVVEEGVLVRGPVPQGPLPAR
jgi:2-phosphosulfolactate phosphatase